MLSTSAPGAVRPEDAWTSWSLEPAVLALVVVAAWLYRRGGSGAAPAVRAWAFWGALVAVVAALVSPIEALAGALASAHMVQHVLLVLLAGPLLALAAPTHRLLRGAPPDAARAVGRWRARLGLTPRVVARLRHPVVAWSGYAAVLWLWHAAALYTAATEQPVVHLLEHATFLGSSWLFWSVVVAPRERRTGSYGVSLLMVFTTAVHATFLSALLTFATSAWYPTFATTTQAFGLTPLADQQLAGVLMWIPGSAVHVGAGIALLVAWLRDTEARSEAEAAGLRVSRT